MAENKTRASRALKALTKAEIAALPHAKLYALREGATQEEQNKLGPAEHQAFVRETTETSAAGGAAQTLLALGYTPVKKLAEVKPKAGQIGGLKEAAGRAARYLLGGTPRSKASVEEIAGAVKGYTQGFRKGIKADAARAALLYVGDERMQADVRDAVFAGPRQALRDYGERIRTMSKRVGGGIRG